MTFADVILLAGLGFIGVGGMLAGMGFFAKVHMDRATYLRVDQFSEWKPLTPEDAARAYVLVPQNMATAPE